MQIPLYQLLAQMVIAYQNCLKRGAEHAYWKHNHQVLLERLVREHMPSGAGVDDGTKIDLDKSTGDLLVFIARFHHMNSDGFYTKWTDHVVTVTPSLGFGISLKISGLDSNGIKDHLGDLFYAALREVVDSQIVCS
jgi:hypothetical protein